MQLQQFCFYSPSSIGLEIRILLDRFNANSLVVSVKNSGYFDE